MGVDIQAAMLAGLLFAFARRSFDNPAGAAGNLVAAGKAVLGVLYVAIVVILVGLGLALFSVILSKLGCGP